MEDSLKPDELMYLGGVRMLLDQWLHFHNGLRQDIQRMSPQDRAAAVRLFENFLAVAQTKIVPDPVKEAWSETQRVLEQWLGRYRQAVPQSRPSLGDFTPDARRLTRALYAYIQPGS